eukprot:396051_1
MNNISTSSWRRYIALFIISLHGISYTVSRLTLVPVQDQLMNYYNIDAVEYNLLMSLYSFPNIVWGILCGILIDKYGIERILIFSWIVIFVGLFVILYSCINVDYIILCVGRIIVGIGDEAM